MKSPAEHLEWVKARALAELDEADDRAIVRAIGSLSSDLGKHPQTTDHPARMGSHQLYVNGELDTPQKVRDYINNLSPEPDES